MFHRLFIVGAMALSSSAASAQPAPAGPAAASSAAVCRLAVTALEGQGLRADQAHLPPALTDALAAAVTDASGCDVISSADIAAIVGFEAQRELCGAKSDACLAELGDALGVDRIVAGNVVQLGTSTTVSVRLVNIKASRVEARAEETTTDEGDVRPLTQRVGAKLFAIGDGATVASDSDGPPLLLIVGGGVAGAGVIVGAVGTAVALAADAVLGDVDANTKAKNEALQNGGIAVIAAAAGGTIAIVGVGLAVVGALSE